MMTPEQATELFIESLDNQMFRAGYEVTGSGVLPDVELTVSCIIDPEYMPTIDLRVNEYAEDTYEVIPTLTFPQLTVQRTDYNDTIHYYLSKWESVGKVITGINRFSFNSADYEDE